MILREMRQQQASLLQAEVTDAVLPQETRIMRSLLDEFHFCESCGAPILAEHLDMGIAERVSGLPFCQACAIESTFLGQRLGDVTLGQIVGAGRLGFVYRGSTGAESGASTLAAKVFHHSLLENSDFTEALKRSIDEAAKFEHPNVIRVHGLHEVGNTLALTMDYGGRFSLNIRLHSGIGEMSRSLQPLTVPDALYIGYNVAQALSYAHSEGTVHGELWPGKIFVTPRGRVGVVGFGIRAEDLFANTPQQKDVRFRGLLAPFEAPEKRKSKQLDPSMDQFSLGAVLYTMLLGKLCNPQTASHDVINEGVVLPKDITQMLARMLDPDASKRFPSIGDYLSALQALMPQ